MYSSASTLYNAMANIVKEQDLTQESDLEVSDLVNVGKTNEKQVLKFPPLNVFDNLTFA